MGGDYSKQAFKAEKHYSDVLMQQGKVQLDSDWNEHAAIQFRSKRALTYDLFDHAVVPRTTKDGFLIEIDATHGLVIHPGRMYVDGLLAENHGLLYNMDGEHLDWEFDAALDEERTAIPVPYQQQPYLFYNADLDELPATPYLVYLDVWQREVTYLKDPDIIEKAVGIDTTTRMQTVWQVRALDIGTPTDPECEDSFPEWDDLIKPSAGRLSTGETPVDSDENPCLIPQSGGYRGLENRLYRVEIHNGGPAGTATFKWARHNASVASAVTHIDGTKLTVTQTQWDSLRRFKMDDWVEVSDDNLEFAGLPGIMAQITGIDYATNTITLDDLTAGTFPLKPSTTETLPERHTRIRKWEQSGAMEDTDGGSTTFSDGLNTVPGTGTHIIVEKGITINFELEPASGEFKTGDYWLFAVRTEDASVEKLNEAPPLGTHHHYARLAIVDGVPPKDCRIHWPPEIKDKTCCTVTVGDEIQSHGDYTTIQAAVDSLPTKGGKVCVLPGIYNEDNIHIDDNSNIIIEGCGERSKVISPGGAAANPIFRITDSSSIRIASLEIHAADTHNGVLVEQSVADSVTVRDIELHNLTVKAASRSAIEVHYGSGIVIQDCHIVMKDVTSQWPGIFMVADQALIKENTIKVTPSLDANNAIVINYGRGGIQIGGTSDNVRVIDNLIQGGIGNGITLGSLTGASIVGAAPGEQWVGWVDDPNTGEYESLGNLYDILIEHNRIFDMGMNGIGVAAFFDDSISEEMITIDQLEIDGNDIRKCLSKTLPDIPADMFDQMGYGGVALSDVEGLSIHNNTIEDNGPDFIEPICGIFILHSEGVEISDNRIVNNGAKSFGDTGVVKKGRRAGIEIVLAIVPSEPLVVGGVSFAIPWQKGEPAVKVHNNIVVQPYGRALSLTALGPVSVSDNQFTSHGLSSGGKTSSEIGSTVMILNLGISDEFYLQQLMTFSSLSTTSPGSVSETSVLDTSPDIPPLANGNVLFSNNQCRLDILNGENNLVLGSIVIFSLDDIGFHSNQCDCRLDLFTAQDGVLASIMLLGLSIRASDNRIKEGLFRGIFSIFSWGLFMNTVTDNQTTHCLAIWEAIFPNCTIREHNIILINPIFKRWCEIFSNLSKGKRNG